MNAIIEIDLSNLDTSKVINMESMFYGCSNLKKINFGNINTTSVTNMNRVILFLCKFKINRFIKFCYFICYYNERNV